MSHLPISFLAKKYPDAVLSTEEFRGEHTAVIRKEDAKQIFRYLRDEQGFDYLVDISSIDNHESTPRWEMVYELYRMASGDNDHLRIKFAVAEGDKVETVTDLWPTANWHEREVYDMMGIEFDGLVDHRRILMWEGYPYFPLRKDFPLAGRPSEMPDVAFTDRAPLEGGPFVTSPTSGSTVHREPRSRDFD